MRKLTMDYRDKHKQLEKEIMQEQMREVRSFKRRPESLSNKKRRFSDDEQLVEEAHKKIKEINQAVAKIMFLLEDLEDKHAQALQLDSISQLFLKKIDLPSATTKKLKKLTKLRRKLAKKTIINDFRVLELFDQLNSDELTLTTLKILEKNDRRPELREVIETIKRIHVEKLTNYRIDQKVLEKFIKNKHVVSTRPDIDLILGNSGIDYEFECKLKEE